MRAFAVAIMLTAVGPGAPMFHPFIDAKSASHCPRGSRAVDLRFVWIPPKAKRARTLFDGPKRLLGVVLCSNGTEVYTSP